jgi:putative spermidine/putrescine transport system ATP-binding protein/spermidine/putrescine transport system ATP-binding protein
VLVPARTLESAAAGAAVDLFVRPEDLRVADPGTPAMAHGVVAAQVYHGGHVDLYVDVAEAVSTRVLMRVSGAGAMARWPVGTHIAIALAGESGTAFPQVS